MALFSYQHFAKMVLPASLPTIFFILVAILLVDIADAFGGRIRRFIWRYPKCDASRSEALPIGQFPLCPLKRFQDNPKESSPDFGPGLFFYRRSKRLKHSRIWKFLSGGKTPVVIVSGYNNTKEMLNMEFSAIQGQATSFVSKVVGTNSLRMTHDKREHSALRRLVGSGMTPSNVAKMIPNLQAAAEDILSKCAETTKWKMHELCADYTLDVATKQIVGLQVEQGEFSVFRKKVSEWLNGIFSQEMDEAMNARKYLVEKIEARIKELERSKGEMNTSALARMVYAVDEENGQLTKDQIIENTLLLIFAGSETSSGTLTLCILLLGLHPDRYSSLVQEQQKLCNDHGHELTNDILQSEMPYLDAVLKESLRLRPVVGGSMRGTTETVVVGGRQVPAGWLIAYDRFLTHLLDPKTFVSDESHMDVRSGFQPERWFHKSTRPTTEFIPFGVGPRRCLGADFAMAEMKIFLAVLVRNLAEIRMLEPASDCPIEWKQNCIVPVPAKGVVLVSSMTKAIY